MKLLLYGALLMVSLVMVFPFFYMLSTACKDEVQLTQPTLLPEGRWHFENFPVAWSTEPFNRFMLNSALVGLLTTGLTLLLASMAGFALAKYRFRGQKVVFLSILATMMIPGQVTMVPNFLTCSRLGLLDSYAGLVIPVLPLAFGIFLMRQFMQSVPTELLEAGRIDGAGDFRLFGVVALPLCKPALVTLGIFTFMGSWNSFLWALIILDTETLYTLPIGLLRFAQQYEVRYNYLMAVSLISILPILMIFALFQRAFVQGMTLTGMKE